MLRDEYPGDGLFDLAAAESTAPDGSRAGSDFRGQYCNQLYDGYAADEGHLNREGAQVVATAWLKAVARTRGK
jgi:lysophospholipase L1-like esterase